MNIPELIQKHVGALEERVSSLKAELDAAASRVTNAEAFAERYRKDALDNEEWLVKIRRLLSVHGKVNGDYEQSIKALIEENKVLNSDVVALRDRLEALSQKAVDTFVIDARDREIARLVDKLTQARMDRDQAIMLLRDRATIEASAKNFLAEYEDDDTDY